MTSDPPNAPLVLIVDDNEGTGSSHRTSSAPGLRTIEAASGRAPWRSRRDCSPDIVLLDLRLPDMEGREVARALLEGERTARIPVVALTALRYSDGGARLLAEGSRAISKSRSTCASFPEQVRGYGEHRRVPAGLAHGCASIPRHAPAGTVGVRAPFLHHRSDGRHRGHVIIVTSASPRDSTEGGEHADARSGVRSWRSLSRSRPAGVELELGLRGGAPAGGGTYAISQIEESFHESISKKDIDKLIGLCAAHATGTFGPEDGVGEEGDREGLARSRRPGSPRRTGCPTIPPRSSRSRSTGTGGRCISNATSSTSRARRSLRPRPGTSTSRRSTGAG